ncbi:MAG: ABC transporter ATP-binding protein, partial [bacterium]
MSDLPAGEVAVRLSGVTKAYDHRPVLRGIDLYVRRGETVAVLGANGSGKSTLLRLVATLTQPTRGSVVWFEEPAALPATVRRRIGLLPHESLLYDGLTVEENLRFFAGLYGLPASSVEPTIGATGLEPLRGRRARILSRGQRQQVDLARVLLHDPQLVILDEPFTGLDLDAARRLTAMIRQGAGGRAVLFATHDPGDAQA